MVSRSIKGLDFRKNHNLFAEDRSMLTPVMETFQCSVASEDNDARMFWSLQIRHLSIGLELRANEMRMNSLDLRMVL